MRLFAMEHSKGAYGADFVAYIMAVVVMATALVLAGPQAERPGFAALAVLGLALWTAVEYVIHRFVLHGLQPFQRWHEAHHERPTALICSPTVFSASLIATLVFLPAWALSDLWRSCALTLGLVSGYLAYAVTHHATHHWRADGAWLRQRKRWHALHHHVDPPACFGVTSSFWDHVFRTSGPR